MQLPIVRVVCYGLLSDVGIWNCWLVVPRLSIRDGSAIRAFGYGISDFLGHWSTVAGLSLQA